MTYADSQERRLYQIGPIGARPADEFDIAAVMDALNDLSDDACEETRDHYEWDADLEQGAVRIWFGLVPPGSPDGAWREVLPELEPIPLNRLRA